MVNYLLKILYLLVVSIFVIFTYYFNFSFHQEIFSPYTSYLVITILLYGLYKAYNLFFYKEVVKFKVIDILGFFFLHLLVLSILYFTLNGGTGGYGITLFMMIIGYLILPTFIIFISLSFGKFVLSKIKGFSEESSVFQFLMSLGFGFFSFVTLLTVLGFFGAYNYYSFALIILAFIGASYKEIIYYAKGIISYKFEFQNHKAEGKFYEILNLNLLTTELLFIILTFLLSVNLINIVRPMPIGWDDLGVYMNYPQLLANAGEILPLGGMLSWQIFTGIGYMFNSATESFFLNNVGGVLSVIVISLTFKDLLLKNKKSFINIPLLSATIFASMPMIIFQQAKDMKLDPGLFFVSAIALYGCLYLFLKYLENKKEDIFSDKKYLIYLFVIGIIVGLSFSIKLTSLLLISGIIGLIFYSKLGLSGLFSYIVFYIGIFTKLGLWDTLNVVYPKDDMAFRNYVFLGCFLIGILFLAFSIYRHKILAFKRFCVIFLAFISGMVISLLPWIVKNYTTLNGNISIMGLINGDSVYFKPQYTNIYTQAQIDEIKKKGDVESIDSSGTAINEDLGRYFGYENGINNYIKLPYNLTMQTNQRGEYTDITYIFLALVPIIILFLSFSSQYFSLGYFFITLLPFLFFFIPFIGNYFTKIFTDFSLPFGYLIIAILFLLPFLYLMFTIDNKRQSLLFKLILAFSSFYIFLWTISAFGIVWYGIVMYYSFLLIIALGLENISTYSLEDEEKVNIFKLFGSVVLFLIISFYFFNSSIPHGFSNLKGSGYTSFKAGLEKKYVSIFNSHGDYFGVLLELNIAPEKREELFNQIKNSVTDTPLKSVIGETKNISELEGVLDEIANMSGEQAKNIDPIQLQALKNSANNLRNDLYYNILHPKKEFQNNSGIYRIGTFLRYFIVNNNVRLMDDSLVFEFGKFIYDEKNVDNAAERMKKAGMNYFLVDLNAATIDKDPRRDLTHRYDNLLKTFTSSKLELVSTDSICLKVALENYKKSPKSEADLEEYMTLAGVNYESYDSNGKLTQSRQQKTLACYNKILELMRDGKIDNNNYSYLSGIQNYLVNKGIDSEEELLQFFSNYIAHGWMVLFKIN